MGCYTLLKILLRDTDGKRKWNAAGNPTWNARWEAIERNLLSKKREECLTSAFLETMNLILKPKQTALAWLIIIFTTSAAMSGRADSLLNSEVLKEADAAVEKSIGEGNCPGGVVWIEHKGEHYAKAYGKRSLVPTQEAATEDTIYDLASLTKVIAGTPAMMKLIEEGKVKLDERVQTYIPEFKGEGKEAITVRELLTHTSGLIPDIEAKSDWHGRETAYKMACVSKLRNEPGTVFRYSDVNLFMVGAIVERASGMKLEDFVQKEIYGPLKMTDTGYLPPKEKLGRMRRRNGRRKITA